MKQEVQSQSSQDRYGTWSPERAAQIPVYKRIILDALREGLWISEICQQIQVGTRAVREWRQQDTHFGEAYREAEEAFIDSLEREAVRRAMSGVADVVIHAGRVVMDPRTAKDPDGPKPLLRRTYSDGLMMFVLKGRRREVYGDRVETDNKHQINFDDARLRLEQKLRQIAQAGVRPSGEPPNAAVPEPSAEPGAAADSGAGDGAPREPLA